MKFPKKILPYICLLSVSWLLCQSMAISTAKAQDVEFSQFYAAPLHLNPAMIGFTDQPRLVLNYRHQYPSFSNAYVTLGASYDQHFEDANSSIGISLLGDRAGGGLYNTYIVSGLYAYQLELNENLQLKAGAQASYIQQSLNWGDLVFPDMINPLTGEPDLVSTQVAPDRTALYKLDFSLGVAAYTDKFYIGAAFKHVTSPELSFYNENTDAANVLKMRVTFHVGRVFYFSRKDVLGRSRFYVNPNIAFTNQGKFNQFNANLQFGKGAIFGGVGIKHAISNMDAFTALVGVRSGAFRIGYSYDFNLAALATNAGAHEVSLTLDFGQTRYAERQRRRNSSAKCPETFR